MDVSLVSVVVEPGQPPVEYRDVPEFPGYKVGSDGSLWSCRAIGSWRITDEWRQLSTKNLCVGYPYVCLYRNGEKHHRFMHRLVMLTFVGPCPEGKEVAHENGDRADSRLCNLTYKTPSENQMDRVRHGTDGRGKKNHATKLTEDQVRRIRAEYVRGKFGLRRLSLKYGVSQRAIKFVLTGRNWNYVA